MLLFHELMAASVLLLFQLLYRQTPAVCGGLYPCIDVYRNVFLQPLSRKQHRSQYTGCSGRRVLTEVVRLRRVREGRTAINTAAIAPSLPEDT